MSRVVAAAADLGVSIGSVFVDEAMTASSILTGGLSFFPLLE